MSDAHDVANRPGHISFDRGNGDSYTGCKLEEFDSIAAVNEFFEQNTGYLVVDIKPISSYLIFVTYTSVLTVDQMSDLQEWGKQMDSFMAERRAMREASKQSQRSAAETAAAEDARLRELGRKCEQNHPKTERRMKR